MAINKHLLDNLTSTDEILREILIELSGRSHPTGGISKMVEITSEREERDMDIVFWTYPYTGATATCAAGVTTLNFEAGTIVDTSGTVTNMQHSLHSEGKEFLRSLYVNSDKAIKIQMDTSDQIFVDDAKDFQGTYFQFKQVKITCTENTEVFVLACSNPEAILTLVDKASEASGGSRLVRGDTVVETAGNAAATFKTDEVLGTDQAALYLDLFPATTIKFKLTSIRFMFKPAAAQTYRLYLLESNTDPAGGAADVQQKAEVIYDSGAGMVGNTDYVEIGGGVLPQDIVLSDTAKLYYLIDWSAATATAEGYLLIRGEKLS